MQGIEPIKNHNKQELFSLANKTIYEKFQTNIFSLGKIQIRLSFLANVFGVLFLMAILTYMSYRVLSGQMKTGELIAVLGMAGSLLPSVANLAVITIPLNEAKIAFDRMFEFTSIQPELDTNSPTPFLFENLAIQNLRFRFVGRKPVIRDISLQLKKGEIIAIMGENGCGKSTLVQLLQKFYEPEAGRILLNGDIRLSDIPPSNWRAAIGVVPQNIHIFNGTVLENIVFDELATNAEKVLAFLHQYGFAGFIDSLPQSVMTLVGEEGINLSGGQKQMIAIARALYTKPQLLILDEATAAMDRQSEQFVLQLLNRLKNEVAVIFITHRLHVLKSFCDRIYILEDGVIKNSGNHAELLGSPNLYSSYWQDLKK